MKSERAKEQKAKDRIPNPVDHPPRQCLKESHFRAVPESGEFHFRAVSDSEESHFSAVPESGESHFRAVSDSEESRLSAFSDSGKFPSSWTIVKIAWHI